MDNLKMLADVFGNEARNQNVAFLIGYINSETECLKASCSVYDMMKFMHKMMEPLPREGKALIALFVTFLYTNEKFDFNSREAHDILADMVLAAEELIKDETV